MSKVLIFTSNMIYILLRVKETENTYGVTNFEKVTPKFRKWLQILYEYKKYKWTYDKMNILWRSWHTLSWVFWVSPQLKGLWSLKPDTGADLSATFLVNTTKDTLLSLQCLGDNFWWFTCTLCDLRRISLTALLGRLCNKRTDICWSMMTLNILNNNEASYMWHIKVEYLSPIYSSS